MTPAERLEAGAAALGIDLDAAERERLLGHALLLAKWNRVYNLTALREPDSVLTGHLLDSLAVLPHLDTDSLADIGSGGGLPGIPLAIARPHWRIALVEASHKKASFLTQAKIELGLANVEVVCGRAEHWNSPRKFGCVISRAFSDLAGFVSGTAHLLAPGGTFAAMKGAHPSGEIARLPAGCALDRVVRLTVPGLAAARHLVIVRRT
ncbi:MAG: 16S rRNA (guanine(527)-N(7))-methyltransferase RsmG [Rhodocyclaceae bacterium]